MEITKLVALGLVGCVIALFFKKENPHIAVFVGLVTGCLIFFYLISPLNALIMLLKETADKAGVGSNFFNIVLKVIGIAYIVQFGAGVCLDAGEGAIASKIEFAGKVVIMATSVPVLTALLDLIVSLV